MSSPLSRRLHHSHSLRRHPEPPSRHSGESRNPERPATRRWLPVALLVIILLTVALACSSQSPNIGKFYKGRILHISVAAMERTDELRWTTSTRYPSQGATGDPLFRLEPGSSENELILLRVKVENHTATSAIVNVDHESAQLRDFLQGRYFPIDVNARAQEAEVPENPSDRCNVPVNPDVPTDCVKFLWNATYEETQPYGGDLLSTSVPDRSAFTAQVNGSEVDLIGDPVVSNSVVTLTLANEVSAKDLVKVSYTDLVENPLQDRAGNSVSPLVNQLVTNIAGGSTPLMVTVRDIKYDEALGAVSAIDNDDSDATYWRYRIQGDDACTTAPPDDARAYIEGENVKLTSDHSGQYVCFWSMDEKSGHTVVSQGRSPQVKGIVVPGATPPSMASPDAQAPSLYTAFVDGATMTLIYGDVRIVQRSQELPKGTGLDGWMVFEVPKDTQFRSFRWSAGDTVTIDF